MEEKLHYFEEAMCPFSSTQRLAEVYQQEQVDWTATQLNLVYLSQAGVFKRVKHFLTYFGLMKLGEDWYYDLMVI